MDGWDRVDLAELTHAYFEQIELTRNRVYFYFYDNRKQNNFAFFTRRETIIFDFFFCIFYYHQAKSIQTCQTN